MKKNTLQKLMLGLAGTMLAAGTLQAQSTTTTMPSSTDASAPAVAPPNALYDNAVSGITNGAGVPKPGGTLWGYVFGDYAYMQNGDSAGRGTKMQYKGLGATGNQQVSNPDAFEVRRAYLGYTYNVNSKFSAYGLLAYEGDYDANNNRTVYLKYIYFKWKNIFKGSDLKIGQQATCSFASAFNTEPLMDYRSIEKTILDMHGIDGSSDMGINLGGKLWKNTPADSTQFPTFIGYNLMVGDNSGNTPVPVFTGAGTAPNATTDKDKKFRANLFLNTLNGALTIGLYTDYINYGDALYNTNIASTNYVPYNSTSSHIAEAVSTDKIYAVYNGKCFGIGFEWFTWTMTNGETETWAKGSNQTNDTVNAVQTGFSVFAHATIIRDKLNIFARYDSYTPDADYSYSTVKVAGTTYTETFTTQASNVSSITNTYNGVATKVAGNTYKETFITGGLDWTVSADKRIHLMPNIWYYGISNGFGSDNLKSDNYMLYRITFLCAF